MIQTNENRLVKISVQGGILSPGEEQDYLVGPAGAHVVPSWGGICYNVKVGQRCMGLVGDHIEPGVSVGAVGDSTCTGLSTYACIGNEAVVTSGDARGERGFVTGKHDRGRIMVYFPDETLERLFPDDRIMIKAYGQGLALAYDSAIRIMNLDPSLFAAMGMIPRREKLIVPVAKRIPAYLLGSGLGGPSAFRGDIDIMTQDGAAVEAHGLRDLRFGDIVLLEDCDCTFGRGYRKGAVTIGVVSHGDSALAGHGPGVTAVLTSPEPLIEGIFFADANLAMYHPMTRHAFLRTLERRI